MKGATLDKPEEMNGSAAAYCLKKPTTQDLGNKYEEKMKEQFSAKIYLNRDSVLTEMMDLNHLRTVHNIVIGIFLLLVLLTTAFYVLAPEEFAHDMALMTWATSQMKWFFIIWIGLHISCICVMFPTFSLWSRIRNKFPKKLTDITFLFLYVNYLILTIVIPAYFLYVKNIPPITAFSILGEQLRLWMKTHSFVRENAPKVLNQDLKKDDKKEKHFRPNLRHFIYFLFAPTLVYRDSYPMRTAKTVRWGFVLSHLLQVFCCIFIMFSFFMRFTVTAFGQACLREFRPSELVLIYAGCIFGYLKLFMGFYFLLHCWMNAFAEMLRFGDRQFYQDWWNSTSFSQYYRRWNGVVYDWLHAYIHTDIYKLTGNRGLSRLTVFITSAIFHEYVMAMGLRFFFPVLCLVYLSVGVLLLFVTNKRSSQHWNIFMWFMLFSGWGLLEFLYSFEWYARANTPTKHDGLDFFIPRILSCKIVGA